jgi:DNA repair exonuclease SbcCD nuclease subunit
MKLRVLSDLHLEFQDWRPPKVPADVIVLAGDIHSGIDGILWGRQHFPEMPIVYVPGNHEFYGREMETTLTELRRTAKTHRVHLLDGDAVVIEGVRILGATLWTDFALYGAEPSLVARAKAIAQQAMADYFVIRRHGNALLAPEDTQQIHQLQARWLARELEKPFAGATVVVTHHLPLAKSVHARYEGDALNPSFASDLSRLVRTPVKLWIHGHTHESMDYAVAGTRVLCNPRGYLPQEPNARFKPRLVVEI